MGKWIYDTPVHTHDHPANGQKDKPVGAIWECECKEWFRLKSSRYSGDQRDWCYLFTWEHLPMGTTITLNDGSTMRVGSPVRSYNGIYPPGTK
jgi:hypothetical protein